MEEIKNKIIELVEKHTREREFSGSDFYFEMLDELTDKEELIKDLFILFQGILSERNV